MTKQTRPVKTIIIEKSLEIIESEGAAKLSFEHLVAKTGMSKGGILYHFPSKDALLEGIVIYTRDVYLANYHRFLASEPRPGRALEACLRNLSDDSYPSSGIVYTALQAVLAEKPALLGLYKAIYTHIRQDILADGGNVAAQWAVLATIDGMWMGEIMGFYEYTDEERMMILKQIAETIASI